MIFPAMLLLAAAAAGSPAKLPPVDQCVDDRSFETFRAELRGAVVRRDREAFLQLLAPDVLIDFGGGAGRKAFADQWFAENDEKLWHQLDLMLRLGCGKADGARVIPSLSVQFDSDEPEDVFEKLVVVSDKAELRAGPEPDSKVVATLAWDVVNSVEADGDVLMKVRLADGREGWLPADQLYSPLDYRAVMEKRGDKWMITAFIAGD